MVDYNPLLVENRLYVALVAPCQLCVFERTTQVPQKFADGLRAVISLRTLLAEGSKRH